MTEGQPLTIRDLVDQQAAEEAYTMTPEKTVRQAASAMQAYGVSAIAVVDDDGVLVGILSEMDVSHLVAKDGDPDVFTVAEVMTENPITVNLGTPLGKTAQDMLRFNIRHLPVVENRRPLTTIAMPDVLSVLLDQTAVEAELLRANVE
jgi:MHS family proline/betaine transporter-like MFS transporter